MLLLSTFLRNSLKKRPIVSVSQNYPFMMMMLIYKSNSYITTCVYFHCRHGKTTLLKHIAQRALNIPPNIDVLYCEQGKNNIWAATCDFQQCGILTWIDSDEPVQPSVKLRNSKCCSVSSFTIIEYLSDFQRLWSDCTYVQADLRLCWSHIPHCWKSHALAHL